MMTKKTVCFIVKNENELIFFVCLERTGLCPEKVGWKNQAYLQCRFPEEKKVQITTEQKKIFFKQ